MHLDLSALDPVFLTSQARAAGIDPRRLAHARDRRVVTSLGRGVWADQERWPEDHVERHRMLALAAARAVTDSAVSHVSAAILLDLPHPRGRLPRPCVTVDDGVRSRSPGSWMTLYRGHLPSDDAVQDDDGSRTTIPARTVVDCAGHLLPGDGLAIADAALRRGLVTRGGLHEVRRKERRWPGVRRAERVLRLADGRRESWLESWSASAFERMALPRWVPQVNVRTAAGAFIGRVDGCWPEQGLVGEADGRGKYLGDVDPGLSRDPEAVADRVLQAGERESALRGTGLGVVRWTTHEIVHQPLVVRARWVAERGRIDCDRVTADLRCSCCDLHPTSCEFSAVLADEAA